MIVFAVERLITYRRSYVKNELLDFLGLEGFLYKVILNINIY